MADDTPTMVFQSALAMIQRNVASIMKLNRWFVCVVVLVIVGCHSQSSVERQIQASIKSRCHAEWPCSFNLRGATSFDWDELYVFKDNASKADIEKATHATLSNYRELTSYLIFELAGKPVWVESEPTNVEHPIKDELVFDIPDATVYEAFPATSEFMVTQTESIDGPHFLLKQK